MWPPFPVENLVSSAVEALKIQGDARAIAVLVAGQCSLDSDEGNMNISYWILSISLDVKIFFAMTEEDREAVKTAITGVISPFFASTPDHALSFVNISPLVNEPEDGWREDAMRFVQGEGVTNQGRVRSDNIASKEHQGLLFRCNRPGNSSSVAGSIVLRDCATMKLSPQCRSGTAGHHHPSQTRSKHFLVLSTIETLEIPFKRCWIT